MENKLITSSWVYNFNRLKPDEEFQSDAENYDVIWQTHNRLKYKQRKVEREWVVKKSNGIVTVKCIK